MPSGIGNLLRRIVEERASFLCEYCKLHDQDSGSPHHIDHIVSQKHGGETISSNLAFCCYLCNRAKGSDIATLGVSGHPIRLFHPRLDAWGDHFRIEESSILELSDVGHGTVRLLQMNVPERVKERLLLQKLGSFPRQ